MKLFWQIIAISFLSISITFAQNSTSQFRNFVLQKDFERAGEVAQNALNENPNDFELAITVGDVYFELEEFNNALDAYSRARNINSRDNRAAAKVANALVALGRAKEAIDDLRKLLDKDKRNMELILALANAYLANGETRNAEMQVTNARSIDSKNPNVFSMLGKIYFEQNVWELARTNYEEALKLDANNVYARQQLAEVYWKLAVSADNAGETDLLNEYLNRSLEQCNILVQKDDKDANSWRLKGQIHFNAKQNLEAAQSYNKFLELRPNNYKERWRLAELLAKNGVCAEAIEHLKKVIDATHQDITDSIRHQAGLLLGTCYFRTQDYENAIKTFTTVATAVVMLNIMQLDPKILIQLFTDMGVNVNVDTTHTGERTTCKRTTCKRHQSDTTVSVKNVTITDGQGMSIDGSNAGGIFKFMSSLVSGTDISELTELFTTPKRDELCEFGTAIMNVLPASALIGLEGIEQNMLALSYLFIGDTTTALSNFDNLMIIAPGENCGIIPNIARLYNSRKDFEGVIRTVNVSIKNCPVDNNTPYLYYLLGTAYFELKRVDESIAALQKAIEINPKYYWAYIYLGDIYFSQRNVAEGEKQFNFVIEDAKAEAENFKNELNSAFSKLAGIALDAKKWKDLERIGKRWIETLPNENEFGHLYLAVAYQGSGDTAGACRHYREVLKINPDNKTARDNLRSLGC